MWGFMTLEQVEVKIADLLTKAKKMQIRAKQFQRQGIMVARQSEVVVREKLNDYFEDGLNLLRKSIVRGRKMKESLAAETHRKMATLKKSEASMSPGKMNSNSLQGARTKSGIKPKKNAQQFSNASRAR